MDKERIMAKSQILIVEDEGIVAKDIEGCLKHLGYGVVGMASSGEEAIAMAGELCPDLVLMDIVLKGEMNGIEAAEQIYHALNIPVVYLTAYSDESTLQRAKITEPYGYILKPFEEKELHTNIEMALYKHKMESKLRENEKWLATSLKSIGDAVIATDIHGLITFMNPVAENLTGWRQGEATGKLLNEVFKVFAEEPGTLSGDPGTHRVKGGVISGLRNHLVLVAKDGREVPIDECASPIKDSWGKALGAILIFHDMTERRKADQERAALQEQLRQSQRMEAIGQLAGGIAHDFNNLLTIIKGYSQLSRLELKEGGTVRGYIEDIEKATERAANLVRQLLAFSRRQVMEMKIIDLNALARDLDKMLRRIIGEDIELITLLADDLGRLKADLGQIEQVILNLAVNARDAMPQGGKLIIETANVELDEAYARSHIAVIPGCYVMLSVTDTGAGMTPEIKERMFEPFYTTKGKEKGTGLGLSTVYGIVKQTGGNIWVYSEPGRGTTFKIYLPRVDEPLEEVRTRQAAKDIARGGETVLIVEDEMEVRRLAVRILERQGYKVLEASHGDDALQVCKEYEGQIPLLVTDVVLPGMSGRKLAERLRSLHPRMKVLYMSGYTDKAIVHNGELEEGMNFIQKPFSMENLARNVRDVLNQQEGGTGRRRRKDE
jgi:two-component system cell cycle sensor histidine kinase/response regulator CckA